MTMTPEHSLDRLKETEITSENSHFTAISVLSINNNLTTNVRFYHVMPASNTQQNDSTN